MSRAAPVILVEDVIRTAEHYRDVLGFAFDTFWGDPPQFAFVDRDQVRIGLMQAPASSRPPTPSRFSDVLIYVDDVDGLAGDFRRRGARIVVEPKDNPIYNGRDLAVADCNGRILSFVQMLD
jgi:predicted enzyme related to lactoylglutathione lyase